MTTYRILRCRLDANSIEVLVRGLTFDQVRAHCNRDDTMGKGWFDAYEPDTDEEPSYSEPRWPERIVTCSGCAAQAPIVRRRDDGHLDVEWPDPEHHPEYLLMSSDLMEEMVQRYNESVKS